MRWLNMTVELIIVAWAGWAVIQSQRRPKTVTRRASPALGRSARPASPPLVTRLGRACGRVYVAWLEGWREPLRDMPMSQDVAKRLPPLLVHDIDLALFEVERQAVAEMPYVEQSDLLSELLRASELGTSDTTGSITPEPRDAVIAKALEKGLSANDLVLLMGGNRAAALAKVRAVREAKAA